MRRLTFTSNAGTPGPGAEAPLATLNNVLRSIAPELLHCTGLIIQIKRYIGIPIPSDLTTPDAKTLRREIDRALQPDNRNQAGTLLLIFKGMKAVMEDYGLRNGQELDVFTAAQKEAFGKKLFKPVAKTQRRQVSLKKCR
jgi:hypothetical protein